MPPNRLYQLIAGKRSTTADTALRLGQYFRMAADRWMNLQSAYELDRAPQENGKEIRRIPKRSETAEPLAGGLRAQGPPDKAPKNGGTRPIQLRFGGQALRVFLKSGVDRFEEAKGLPVLIEMLLFRLRPT